MKSMTGYAISEILEKDYSLSIEIKSYNSKFLDINMNLPKGSIFLENSIKNYIKNIVNRGAVEVNVQYVDINNSVQLNFDENLFFAHKELYLKILDKIGQSQQLTLKDFLSINGLIQLEKTVDKNIIEKRVVNLLKKVLKDFDESRDEDGIATYLDVKKNVDSIKKEVKKIERYEKSIESKIKLDLKNRLQEILGDKIEEDRYLQEIGILLLKYNINEEICRLNSHLKFLEKMLSEKNPIGKKIDFICQEINREINTTASKSIISEINLSAVEIKNYLENIRENIRNVE